MKQKTRLIKAAAAIVFIIAFAFSAMGCTPVNQRVQEALNKAKEYSGVEIKGKADATVDIESLGEDIAMQYGIDARIRDEDVVMVMDINAGFMNMAIEMYMVDGTFLMHMPALIDKYIDASDMLEQVNAEGIGMDLTVFDFDVESTELKTEETTIEFEGKDIDVLKVQVLLNEGQLTDIIQKLFAQQNFSTDAISGQSLDDSASIYESINVESASYTLYIDKSNNIKRYEIDAVFAAEMQGEKATFDMDMEYDIVKTGDSVEVALPEIDPQDIISIDELYNGGIE